MIDELLQSKDIIHIKDLILQERIQSLKEENIILEQKVRASEEKRKIIENNNDSIIKCKSVFYNSKSDYDLHQAQSRLYNANVIPYMTIGDKPSKLEENVEEQTLKNPIEIYMDSLYLKMYKNNEISKTTYDILIGVYANDSANHINKDVDTNQNNTMIDRLKIIADNKIVRNILLSLNSIV